MINFIKKAITVLLISFGFILLLADSDAGFETLILIKVIALAMFCGGIQLCASWKLFKDLDND